MKANLALMLLCLAMSVDWTSCSCVEGCLSCHKDSGGEAVCKVCDLHNSYRLAKSGRCYQSRVENCEVPSSDFDGRVCNLCQPGFFLDNPGNRCSPMPEKFLVPDCRRYRWEYSCEQCNSGFYLSRKKCLPIKTTVDHCQIYADALTCAVCANGYFLHVGSGQCEQLTRRDQCLVYSSVECTQCASNHFQVDNVASQGDLSADFVQSLTVYSTGDQADAALYEPRPVNQCVRGTVANCAKHESFDACAECQSGFFLAPDKKCTSNPVRTVAHCQAYSLANQCSRCVSGFYLEDNICRALTHVDGCLEFESNSEECKKCESSLYFLDKGECGLRVKSKSIEFCLQTNPSDDNCQTCLPSFQLTDDQLNCLPHIPHCREYVSGGTNVQSNDYTNVHSFQLRCKTCDDHFYLSVDALECIPQNSLGCIEFVANTNNCQTCASGFFKSGDVCVKYTQNLCRTFMSTSDACDTCFDGFLKSGDTCVKRKARNCLTTETVTDNCATCIGGYYLKNDNGVTNCEALTVRNCKTFTKTNNKVENACADCHLGYAKVGGSCVPVALLNCAEQDPQANTCKTCKSGYFKDGSSCKPYTVANCDQYEDTQDACRSCTADKFFLDASKNCVQYTAQNCNTRETDRDSCKTCADTINWFINPQGDCIPTHLNHCTAIKVTNYRDECQTCAHGFKLVGGRCYKLELVGCIVYTADECSKCSSGFYLSSGACVPYTATNCKTYSTSSDQCASCVPGFDFTSNKCVHKSVANCEVYNADWTCLECRDGFYLDTTCQAQNIAGCFKFERNKNKCLECQVGRTINTARDTCTLVTGAEGCQTPKANDASKCAICFRGYTLNTTTLACSLTPAITDCIQYAFNTGRCEICILGKVPSANGSQCDAISHSSVANCAKYDQSTGGCVQCSEGHFLADAKTCSAQTVANCKTFKTNVNECAQCKVNHYRQNGECLAYPTIANCLHYSDDRMTCRICANNYYPHGDRCLKNLLKRCKGKVPNQNKCSTCQENYEMAGGQCGGEIESESDSNCQFYDKDTNTCTMCKKDAYLDANKQCQADLITTGFRRDPICVGNSMQGTQCNFCPQGNISVPLPVVEENTSNYTGCAKVDLSNGNCKQCKPDHNMPASSGNLKTCISITPANEICKQLKPNATAGTTLANGENCAECRDKVTRWLNSTTCDSKEEFNVIQLDQSDGTPVCAKGSQYMTVSTPAKDIEECGFRNDHLSSSPVTNCLYYDFKNATPQCTQCKRGFGLAGDGQTCTKATNYVTPSLHFVVNSSNQLEVNTYADTSSFNSVADFVINNTTATTQSFIHGVCKTGHLRVVDWQNSGFSSYAPRENNSVTVEHYRTNYVTFGPVYPKHTCTAEDTKFVSNGTAAPPILGYKDRCSYWMKNSSDFWFCAGCVGTFYPIFSKATHQITGGATGVAFTENNLYAKSFVSDCVDISTVPLLNTMTTNHFNNVGQIGVSLYLLKSDYKGMQHFRISDKTPETVRLNFTNCDNINYALIVFAYLHNDGNSNDFLFLNDVNYSSNIYTGNLPNIACVNVRFTDATNTLFNDGTLSTNVNKYDFTGGVDNCEINVWYDNTKLAVDGTLDYQATTSTNVFKCVACRPGYTPIDQTNYTNTFSKNEMITACHKINNCNTTYTTINTWLNACETCNTGHTWITKVTDKFFLFHYCAPSADANCLIQHNTTGTTFQCILCKKGYKLSATNTCDAVATPYRCDKAGLPHFEIDKSAIANNQYNVPLTFNFIIIKLLGDSYSTFCDTCASGYPLKRSVVSASTCTFDHTTFAGATLATNCDVYDPSGLDKCLRCSDSGTPTYVVKDSDKTCVDNTAFTTNGKLPGCLRVDTASSPDPNICKACKVNYTAFGSGASDILCYDDGYVTNTLKCQNFNGSTGKCEICLEGHIFDRADPLERTCKATDNECNQETLTGLCIKCVAANHFPINYKTNGASSNPLYTFHCVDQGNSDFDKLYATQVVFDFSNNMLSTVENTPSDKFLWRHTTETTYTASSGKNYKDRCLKVFHAPFANCMEASTNGFQCSKCRPGYFLETQANDFNKCVAYDTCFRRSQSTNTCELCHPEYKLDATSGKCVARTLTGGKKYDPVCTANKSGDVECDFCPQGNQSFEILHYPKTTSDHDGCIEKNTADDNCKTCDKGRDYAAASTSCADNNDNTRKCRMLLPTTTSNTTLADDNCYYCEAGNIMGTSNTCVDTSTIPYFGTGTATTTPTLGTCLDGYKKLDSARTRDTFECRKWAPTPIAGCVVYNTDQNCALCENGKQGTSTCTDVTDWVATFPVFTTTFELMNRTTSAYSNFDQVGQQQYGTTFFALQCVSTLPFKTVGASDKFTASVKYDYGLRSSYKPRKHVANADMSNLEFFPSYPNVNCEPFKTTYVLFTDATPSVGLYTRLEGASYTSDDTDCGFWFNILNDEMNCLRCYDDHIPSIGKTTQTRINTAETGTAPTFNTFNTAFIKTCEPAASKYSNMKRSFQGLGYHNFSGFHYGGYFSVDNCDNANESLVVLVIFDGVRMMYPFVTLTGVAPSAGFNTNHICVDITNNAKISYTPPSKYNLNPGKSVENCQVNLLEMAHDATLDKIEASHTFLCAACRPGYHPFSDVTMNKDDTQTQKTVGQCSPIIGCVSGGGTWMNACSECAAGYAWNWDATNKVVQMHYCVDSTNNPNCLVVSGAAEGNCAMCKKNFVLLDNKKCVAIENVAKKGCADTSTYGFMSNDLSYVASKTDISRLTLFFVQYQFQEMAASYSPFCDTCATDHKLTRIAKDATGKCSNAIDYHNWSSTGTFASNCDRWSLNSMNCVACKTNYIVVSGDYASSEGTCYDYSSISSTNPYLQYCYSVKDTTDFHCTKCKEQYKEKLIGTPPNQYKFCYDGYHTEFNCKTFDFTNLSCTTCNDGFVADSTNNALCVESPTADGTCLITASNGRCIKCKGTNYYPFHWKLANATYKHKCIQQDRALPDWIFYNVRGFDLKTNQYFVETDAVPWNVSMQSISDIYTHTTPPVTTPTGDLDKVSHVCMNTIHPDDMTNCQEANEYGFKCSKCADTFGLKRVHQTHNSCFSDCAETDISTGTCVKCSNSANYLSAERTSCAPAYVTTPATTKTANCSYKSPFADMCVFCNSGYYLADDHTCKQQTNMSTCANPDPYSDNCLLCQDGYSLENGVCVMNSLDNCRLVDSTDSTTCLVCDSQSELVDGKCQNPTFASFVCKTRDSAGDCASCFDGYALKQGACTRSDPTSDIAGCLDYDHHGYLCVNCEPHLVLTNGHCRAQELDHCAVMSEDQRTCIRCKDQFFTTGAMCVPRRVFNCAKYTNDRDECLACHPGAFLEQGVCNHYTVKFCRTLHPHRDECVGCVDGYYFNEVVRECVKSQIEYCQVRDHVRDACYVCLPTHFLDDAGLCQLRTVDNCARFDPSADSCIECSASHYLTTTGSNPCKPYTVRHCKTFDPYANQCLLCKRGYFKHATHGCLAQTAFNCASWDDKLAKCSSCPEGTYLASGACQVYSVSNCAVHDVTQNACLSCPKGFYLQSGDCLAYTVSDCDNFESDRDACAKCQDGFFLRNGVCQLIAQNNCATHSQMADECTSCEQGYYLQNGACLTYTISCRGYSTTSNQCISCPSGQYLEPKNSRCLNYSVANCDTYSASSNQCETCVAKHYFSAGLCMAYTVTNCDVFHPLFDECVTCEDGFYHERQHCLPYNVANCAKRSPVQDVCLVCEDNHFNLGGNCFSYSAQNCGTFHATRDSCATCKSKLFYQLHVREDLFLCKAVTRVDHCDEYQLARDQCKTCASEYYLDESTNTCHKVPDTVANCKEFSGALTCRLCAAPYYLKDNACVRSDHSIDKCVQYAGNTKCLECDGANMLSADSTLCLKITESSCDTYLDPANCKTCRGNDVINYIDDSNGSIVSGLNGEDLSTRRAVCVDSGIAHCALARRSFPQNTCLQCQSGHFLASSSSCQPVTQTVDNCETYFANGVCAQCASNHVLSTDKQTCLFDVSFLGANCQAGKFFSEPKCYLCRPGYYFDEHQNCVACSMQGCSVCTRDASASCRLCKKGYYMDAHMKCVQNGTASSARLAKEVADDGLLTAHDYQESTARVVDLFVMFGVLIVFLKCESE